MRTLIARLRTPERHLPRFAKAVLIPVMIGLILLLLLNFEDSANTPFLYIGF